MKDKSGSGWTGPAFTFTAEQELEIRRAFGESFPDDGKLVFMRSMAVALTKVASDKTILTPNPRAARDRAEKVARLLAEAASEIGKLTETERDVFDLAAWNWISCSVDLSDLAEKMETAATGFRKAADGHALARGEKVAGPDAASMFVAAQAAVAWRKAFGIGPVVHHKSDFVTVLDRVLTIGNMPVLGDEATRTAITGRPRQRGPRKPKPKNRKTWA